MDVLRQTEHFFYTSVEDGVAMYRVEERDAKTVCLLNSSETDSCMLYNNVLFYKLFINRSINVD